MGRSLLERGRLVEEAAERFGGAWRRTPATRMRSAGCPCILCRAVRGGSSSFYRRYLETDPDNGLIHSNIGPTLFYLNRTEADFEGFAARLLARSGDGADSREGGESSGTHPDPPSRVLDTLEHPTAGETSRNGPHDCARAWRWANLPPNRPVRYVASNAPDFVQRRQM